MGFSNGALFAAMYLDPNWTIGGIWFNECITGNPI
jgi:hypothetical protein